MSDLNIHSHPAWPTFLTPRRDRRGRFTEQREMRAVWIDKEGSRMGNPIYPNWQKFRFKAACLSFERLRGRRAANDFRHDLPPSSGRARILGHPDVILVNEAWRQAKEERAWI